MERLWSRLTGFCTSLMQGIIIQPRKFFEIRGDFSKKTNPETAKYRNENFYKKDVILALQF